MSEDMREKVNELRHKTNAEIIINLVEQLKQLKQQNKELREALEKIKNSNCVKKCIHLQDEEANTCGLGSDCHYTIAKQALEKVGK